VALGVGVAEDARLKQLVLGVGNALGRGGGVRIGDCLMGMSIWSY